MIMFTSRVLIVDDDAALLEALPDALRLRMSEVAIDTCDSATCALDFISRTDYDAIISDIKMPGMDGLALLGEVKTRCPETPTLLITGHGEHDLAVQALRGGAYDFIQKPIDRDYFVASLRRAIRTRQLSRQVEEHQTAMAEMRVARRIQQRLFPSASPDLPGFDIAGASYPASETSGDYYDFIPMLHGGLAVVIGDVSGHGMGPALLMADARAYLRALALTCSDVGEILTRANTAILADTADEHFVTLIFARIDPASRSIVYASAGHTPGYILGSNGDIREELTSTEMPLGVAAEAKFTHDAPLPLQGGDLIVLLTDGIVEAVSSDRTVFGFERALEIVRRHRELPARAIVDALYREVQDFARGHPQRDDITAVVVKVE
ncbi:MAG TPA: SpoIIE family protein phosphatase [Tepidisphaeraceae bacterium]|nr:SpoIIE family protein phosphatase [Tepidisphaeraceae bacterium]